MPGLVGLEPGELKVRFVDENTIVLSAEGGARHRTLSMPNLAVDLGEILGKIEHPEVYSADRRVGIVRLAIAALRSEIPDAGIQDVPVDMGSEPSFSRASTCSLAGLTEVEPGETVIILDRRQNYIDIEQHIPDLLKFGNVAFIAYGTRIGVASPFFESANLCSLCLRFLFGSAADHPDYELAPSTLGIAMLAIVKTMKIGRDEYLEFDICGRTRVERYAPFIGCKSCL